MATNPQNPDGSGASPAARVPGRLRTYLKRLQPPDNWLDFTDLVSKTIVALCAALIAGGLWVYNDHKSAVAAAEQDYAAKLQEQRAESAEGRDTIDLFLKFMPEAQDPKATFKLNTLSSYCNDVAKAQTAADRGAAPGHGWNWFGLVHKAAQPSKPSAPNPEAASIPVYASSVTGVLCQAVADRGQTQLGASAENAADAAKAAAKNNNGLGYANSPAATSQNAAVAASEAAEPAGAAAKWFAVVATLPLSQAASVPQIVNSLNIKLGQGGAFADVHIYCTRISRTIALTSGKEKTPDQAKGRVRLLRNLGLVSDAFAQPNRNWVQSPDKAVPDCAALVPALPEAA